jgi:hypothetical protein
MLPHALVAADTVLTLGDRTEGRVRAPDPATNATALDVDTLVNAQLVVNSPRLMFLLADTGRFTWLDYNSASRQSAATDSLQAGLEWRSAHTRIRLDQTGTYGQQSTESLSVLPASGTQATPPPGGQPQVTPPSLVPPTSTPILYVASQTSVTTTMLVKPWTLYARLGYQLQGGADSSAQAVLPFQQGPMGQAMATYQFAPRDRLLTMANAAELSFSTGTEDFTASIEEQWRHGWTRTTETWLGVGDAAVRTRSAADAPEVLGSSPIAEAAIDQRFGHGRQSGQVRLDVRLSPAPNPLTGLVDEQIRGSLEGKWSSRQLGIRLLLAASESVDQGTSYAVRQGVAEVNAAYTLSPAFIVDAGVRALYQSQNAAGTPSNGGPAGIVENTFQQVVLFVGVSFRAFKVKF